jgi:hypothetical protein
MVNGKIFHLTQPVLKQSHCTGSMFWLKWLLASIRHDRSTWRGIHFLWMPLDGKFVIGYDVSVHRSSKWRLFFRLSLYMLHLMYHIPHPSYPWFNHPNDIWWRVQIFKLLSVIFLGPCYFHPHNPKYCLHHPVLRLCSSLNVRDPRLRP